MLAFRESILLSMTLLGNSRILDARLIILALASERRAKTAKVAADR
jgi:hypothetical protein